MKTYNGWRNRETWNAHLWLSNTEILYNEARAAVLKPNGMPKPLTEAAPAMRDLCNELWPNGETPDGDSLSRIGMAGWRDIAAAFRE